MKTRDSQWIASVVLLGFTLGCSVSRPPAKPSDIAKEYIYHVGEGNLDAAVKLQSARMRAPWLKLGRSEFEEARTAIREAAKERGGVKTIETEIEDIVGETAKVSMTTSYNNGQSETDYFRLVKESGRWKIDDESPWGKSLPTFPPLK